MTAIKTLIAISASMLCAAAAQADVTIGISLPLTGPTSALGLASKNAIAQWPTSIAGQKLHRQRRMRAAW